MYQKPQLVFTLKASKPVASTDSELEMATGSADSVSQASQWPAPLWQDNFLSMSLPFQMKSWM